jgi:Zn-dependent peptidase ImmA (M78 family)
MDLSKYLKLFSVLTFFSLIGLLYVTEEKNKFFENPLSHDVVSRIEAKTEELENIVAQKYHINVSIPVYISDSISNNLFGFASINKNGDIAITLNKNRFKENEKYMIEDVLPHEYAHAIMFVFGDFSHDNGGHTQKWEDICNNIGGKRCERFVQDEDILIEKLGFEK